MVYFDELFSGCNFITKENDQYKQSLYLLHFPLGMSLGLIYTVNICIRKSQF